MTTTTANNKPSDIILKFLEEIVELWNNGRYQKVTEQCVALLKRKKTIENLNLTVPLQRILLQAYIHQDRYDKVSEWDSSTTAATTTREGCKDLVLYARYRTEDYESVSNQSAAAIIDDDDTNDDSNNTTSMHRNLHAQSEFQLNRTEDALSAYQDLLSDIDDDDVESKMEVLTNALAVIAASGCTPTVKLGSNDDDTAYKFWTDEAEMILSREENDVDLFTDLATNLGSIQFLTDPSVATENWLEVAANHNDDGQVEQTNLQWSKHFWYKDVEVVRYDVSAAAPATNNKNNSSTKHNQLSLSQSVAKVNQSLIDDNLSRLPPQPHPKWNMLQVRMYWYDRAILQLRAEKYVECHDSCQSLKKTLSSSASGGKKKKKNNNNKGSGSSNNNNDTSSSSSPTMLWWESRADVILAYAQQAQSKYKDASARLNESLDSIKAASSSSSPSVVIDHATAHVQLHRFVLEQQQKGSAGKKGQQQQREMLKVLKSLPESIQARPAVQLTMDDLEATVVDSSSDEVGNNKTKNTPKSPLEEADILFGQCQYDDACKLYEGSLSSSSKNSSTVDSQLRYVQALAMSGQHEASQTLWQSLESTLLQEEKNTSMKLPVAPLPDGGSLENKSLPRGAAASRSTSISKKLEANNNAAGNQNDEGADKPSREKILRRRARKREEYLKELEKKGDYNPDRPAKPDPERWIPKHERSRSRRGRNNNNKGNNRSAQGGGSNKDAERLGLDAAARRAGKVPVSSAPSTATMKVSSGGGKGRRRR
ncbi:MAG: hypothetical protein ACI8RD_001126 [Bacillariaceae sp.]|jgi:hypothetical protein